jgi:type I restriction enzyme S subunit
MGSDIKSFTVQELVDQGILAKPLDGNHGEIHPKSADFVETGIPFVMASDLKDGAVDLQGCKNISKVQAQTLRKGFAKEGDVLLSHKATIGRTAIVDKIKTEYIVLTPQVTYYRVLDKHRLNPKYLKYYFDSTEVQNLFVQWAGGGSTRLYLGITGQLKLPVYLPDIKNQNQIVTLIDDYNIKLTINHQTNQTLEQMAQALFKSWFVDFDPVIDNALAAGKPIPEELQARAQRRQQQLAKPDHQPLPDDVRQLFPSEFEETEALGWVPKGWEVCSLGEKVIVKRGGSPRPIKDFIAPTGVPWTKISDAPARDSRFLPTTIEDIRPAGLSKTTLLKKGTLILSNSATPGLPKFLDLDACIHDGWLHFPQVNELNDHYLYQLFLVVRKELVQQGNGSVFTNLKTDILKSHNVVVPSSFVLNEFTTLISSIHNRLHSLSTSTNALVKLRDTLLPKLISGELRLPESLLDSETNPLMDEVS